MNFAPRERLGYTPVITPARHDRVMRLTVLFWLGFSVASVLYTVAGLIYFLAV